MGAGGSIDTKEILPSLPAEPPPLHVTGDALCRLAWDAGGLFATTLESYARQELERWRAEFEKLEKAADQLKEAKRLLEEDRRLFEEEKQRFASGSSEASDIVELNVGGKETVSVSRAALTQCKGSFMATGFSGRWDSELPKDSAGRIFIDFPPELFMPLVNHLRVRRIEETPTPPPAPLADPVADELFVEMLQHFGILDWLYRQRAVDEGCQVRIGEYCYAVLPPQRPATGSALTEMRGAKVVVPRGWQVLSSNHEGFEDAIRELTRHSWGCGVLLVQDPSGGSEEGPGYGGNKNPAASPSLVPDAGASGDASGSDSGSERKLTAEGAVVWELQSTPQVGPFPRLPGPQVPVAPPLTVAPTSAEGQAELVRGAEVGSFSGYRTRLSQSGPAGSKFLNPPKWFESVEENGRRFAFAGSSYRIVIRSRAPRKSAGVATAWRPRSAK